MKLKEFIDKLKSNEFVMIMEDGYIVGILPTDGNLIREYLDRNIEVNQTSRTSQNLIVDLGHIIYLEPKMED